MKDELRIDSFVAFHPSSFRLHPSYYAAPHAPAQAGQPPQSKMPNMATPSEHIPLGQLAERYWIESRRPLASLVFLAPLLIVYEAGVLLLGVQNGADVFMRRLLDLFGFGQHFVLPALTVCILLGWHYLSREPWRLSGGILSAMAAECVLLGLCLRVILLVQDTLFHVFNDPIVVSIGGALKEAVGFLGAGIYEELLFRLILLSLLAWGFRRAGVAARQSLILAAVLSSVLFAAAHYLGASGDTFHWFSFLFRFLAGMFFSVLFLYRGFGIAAGSHAVYDVLAWLSG
jgi:membrane protease YdiL (CAAX protease family)